MSAPARGDLVHCWPGVRRWPDGTPGRSYIAAVISDGVVEFGGTDCVRIMKDDGGTDYIALTHIERFTP